MIGQFDSALRGDGVPFRRFANLTAAGIDVSKLTYDREDTLRRVHEYREKITRILAPRFKVAALARSEHGQLVNLDEALEGIAECFRVRKNIAKAPVRIGINVSRMYGSDNVAIVRGAAIMAMLDLCKQHNQRLEIECAYGNNYVELRQHLRIALLNPSEDTIARVACSKQTISEFISCCKRMPGYNNLIGYYIKKLRVKEYDLAFDRIETTNEKEEYEHIITQLKELKLA